MRMDLQTNRKFKEETEAINQREVKQTNRLTVYSLIEINRILLIFNTRGSIRERILQFTIVSVKSLTVNFFTLISKLLAKTRHSLTFINESFVNWGLKNG